MDAWSFVVNKDKFLWDRDTRCWLCKPVTADKQYKGRLAYYRVQYEFLHNPAKDRSGNNVGWDHYLLNQGLNELKPGVTKATPIMLNGQVATEPKLLDANGLEMKTAEATDPKRGPIFKQFARYDQFPFAPLKIKID